MKRIQVRLSWLMGLVVFCAVAFAALRYPLPIISILLWTGVLTSLLLAAIVAWLDQTSVFLKGFVVLGLGYAILAHLDMSMNSLKLLTTLVSGLIYPLIWEQSIRDSSAAGAIQYNDWRSLFQLQQYAVSDFLFIFHAFAAIVHGVVGGYFAVWIKRRIDKKRTVVSAIESKTQHE